jgi:Coenzyme PQQ synthesis protein D (PqqD)
MDFEKPKPNGEPSQDNGLVGEPRPQRRSDLTSRTIDGETVILNCEGGRIHQRNSTAGFTWECCDGMATIPEILDRLVNAYEIDSVTARRDLERVLSDFENSCLVKIAGKGIKLVRKNSVV